MKAEGRRQNSEPDAGLAAQFNEWALVELFGHLRIVGKVSEATLAGGAFLRVDVPSLGSDKAFTRFYRPEAIYSLSPVSEEIARGLMGVIWQRATIRAEVAFTRYADTAKKIVGTKALKRMVHKGVVVTNAQTQRYAVLKELTPGELQPAGLAESIYRSTNAVQYAGKITFTRSQLRSDIDFGMRLKLVGPNTTFTNILPQQITEHPCAGKTEVTYGPAPVATVDWLLDIMRATYLRTTYRMPSYRDSGADPGNQVDTGSDVPGDDTAHSPGGLGFSSVSGPTDLFS